MINVGTRGVFRAVPPFKISSDILTCVGRETLSTLRRQGVDVYKAYGVAGISPDEFKTYTDEIIISLTAPSGDIYYYPEEKILRVNHTEHVPYVKKALVIDLGSHSTSKTFEASISRIIDVFEQTEGVRVSPTVRDISLENFLSLTDHKNLVRKRRSAKARDGNVFNRITAKEDELILLRAQVASLIKFISRYLDGCCNNSVCWRFGNEAENFVGYESNLADMETLAIDNAFLGHSHAWTYHVASSSDIVIEGGV